VYLSHPMSLYNLYYPTTILKHKKSQLPNICSICKLRNNIQFQQINEDVYYGLHTCDNDKCIDESIRILNDMSIDHPIYNINLNRDDLKIISCFGNYKFSTIFDRSKLNIHWYATVGLVHLFKNKMYITVISADGYKIYYPVYSCEELEQFLKYNNIDIQSLSLPDPVKEYLGIPIDNPFKLHFVD